MVLLGLVYVSWVKGIDGNGKEMGMGMRIGWDAESSAFVVDAVENKGKDKDTLVGLMKE